MDFRGIIECSHEVGQPPVKYSLDDCPRCLRRGFYGGVSTNETGDMAIITGEKYLTQAIQKILISKMNRRGYGFNYDLLTGVIEPSTLSVIKREITRCMVFLQQSQQQDKRSGVMYLTSEEISRIEGIEMFQDSSDPRRVNVKISIYTKSGSFLSINQSLLR